MSNIHKRMRYVNSDAPLVPMVRLILIENDVIPMVLLVQNEFANLVPRSHSVTGNVRSGKVRQYTIFHWPLKKGCGNAIYAPIGLFPGSRNERLVFASSCAVLNKYQLCGGKFCFFATPEKLYSKGKSF